MIYLGWVLLVPLGLLIIPCQGQSWSIRAPELVLVPHSTVYLSNGTIALLQCAALGNPEPRIDWLDASGTPIISIPGSRLLLLLTVFCGVVHSELELGNCPPDWAPISEFELTRYTGRWFEIEKFDAGFQLDMICITADYGYINDTTISVTNSGTLLGQPVKIDGYATATDQPGHLDLFFPDVEPGEYNVLYTDYETYTTVYSCEQLGEYKQEYAWVLARTMTVDNSTLDAAEQVFVDNGVSLERFTKTPQGGDCVYSPVPSPPPQP